VTPYLFLLLAVSSDISGTRFGREVAKPTDAARYTYTKLHDIEVPTLSSDNFVVNCLLYQDTERIYVEAGIQNRSRQDLTVAADLISLESGGAKMARIDTGKAAEQIEDAAYRPFVPSPSGKDAASGEKKYDRDSVAKQSKAHIETQEREVMFASMLLALAHEKATTPVKAGAERSIAYTFEQRKDQKAPLRVVIRIAGEVFVFSFGQQPPRV
jgi:hypothetical protein